MKKFLISSAILTALSASAVVHTVNLGPISNFDDPIVLPSFVLADGCRLDKLTIDVLVNSALGIENLRPTGGPVNKWFFKVKEDYQPSVAVGMNAPIVGASSTWTHSIGNQNVVIATLGPLAQFDGINDLGGTSGRYSPFVGTPLTIGNFVISDAPTLSEVASGDPVAITVDIDSVLNFSAPGRSQNNFRLVTDSTLSIQATYYYDCVPDSGSSVAFLGLAFIGFGAYGFRRSNR